MVKKYLVLFQIDLKHKFYAEGAARDVALMPSPATQQLMRQYDLRWNSRQHQSYMVYGQEAGDNATLSYLGKQEILSFSLQSNSPYFLNITELEFFTPGQKLLYFDNLSTINQTGSLARSEICSDEDLLPIHQSPFKVKTMIAVRDAKNQLLTPADSESKPAWSPVDPADSSQGFQIDLREFPAGKYGYDLEPGQTKWFYHPGTTLQRGDIGVVHIFLGNQDARTLPLPQPSTTPAFPDEPESPAWPASKTAFHITFESRETTWRYNIINNKPKDSLVIDNGDTFVRGARGLLRSGTHEATPMTSNSRIKHQERQTLRPKLTIKKSQPGVGSNGGAATIDLPTPDWRNITAEKNGDVFSDMYIFL